MFWLFVSICILKCILFKVYYCDLLLLNYNDFMFCVFQVGVLLFVSNIGMEYFIGLVGLGVGSGISVGVWEFNVGFC